MVHDNIIHHTSQNFRNRLENLNWVCPNLLQTQFFCELCIQKFIQYYFTSSNKGTLNECLAINSQPQHINHNAMCTFQVLIIKLTTIVNSSKSNRIHINGQTFKKNLISSPLIIYMVILLQINKENFWS